MGAQHPAFMRSDDMIGARHYVGEFIIGGQTRIDTRLGHLERDVAVLKTDVAVLKTDVAVLKTDVAETKQQLGRLERATEKRFNRVDAQLERLITLVERDETKRS